MGSIFSKRVRYRCSFSPAHGVTTRATLTIRSTNLLPLPEAPRVPLPPPTVCL